MGGTERRKHRIFQSKCLFTHSCFRTHRHYPMSYHPKKLELVQFAHIRVCGLYHFVNDVMLSIVIVSGSIDGTPFG